MFRRNKKDDEQRYRILPVSPELVMMLLAGRGGEGAEVPVVRVHDIPDGFEVHGVSYNFESQAFLFLVHHESFASVPLGQTIPTIMAKLSTHYPGTAVAG